MTDADRIDLDDDGHLLDEEDAETLTAIDRGIESANQGRVVSAEEARRRVEAWTTK